MTRRTWWRVWVGAVAAAAVVAGCDGGSRPTQAPPQIDLAEAVRATVDDGPVHYLLQTGSMRFDGSGDFDLSRGAWHAEHNLGLVDTTERGTTVLKIIMRTVDQETFFSAGDLFDGCWTELDERARVDAPAVGALLDDLEPVGRSRGAAVPVDLSLKSLLTALVAGAPSRESLGTAVAVSTNVSGPRVPGIVRVVDGKVTTLVVDMQVAARVAERVGFEVPDPAQDLVGSLRDLESLMTVTVSLRPSNAPLELRAPAEQDRIESGCDPGDRTPGSASP
ncbi:MAG: hypothetical protein NTV28_06515 [Propionibacteriales bacterium]|nr:hypothetical protein [Propionibacteriales bacterium]